MEVGQYYIDPYIPFFWESELAKVGLEAGSEYPIPAQDFTPLRGTLTFPPNIYWQEFSIPILNDKEVEFNEDMFVYLFNPSPDLRPPPIGEDGWAYIGNDPYWWLGNGVAGQYYAKVTIMSDDDLVDHPVEPPTITSSGEALIIAAMELCASAWDALALFDAGYASPVPG